MRKFFTNILIIISLFLFIDYICFNIERNNLYKNCLLKNLKFDKNIKYLFFFNYPLKNFYEDSIKKINSYASFIVVNSFTKKNLDITKKPVLIFGCSYAHGLNIDKNKSLSQLFANYSNRITLNFSNNGWGAGNMLFLTENDNFYHIIKTFINKYYKNSTIEPEYAIYVYMFDHINRLTPIRDIFYENYPNICYKSQNNKLILKKYNKFHKLMFKFFIYRKLLSLYYTRNSIMDYNLLYKIIAQSYFNLKNNYKDIKFIIFIYKQPDLSQEEISMFKNLQKIGINVISSEQLTNENLNDNKYTISDGYHPNEKAWELLSKPLVQKIENL